jgi:hypothetical protein
MARFGLRPGQPIFDGVVYVAKKAFISGDFSQGTGGRAEDSSQYCAQSGPMLGSGTVAGGLEHSIFQPEFG